MRLVLCAALAMNAPVHAAAQAPDAQDPALESSGYVALSADDEAQASLGGFRRYLERIRPTDEELYLALDPELDGLESRETWSDVVFWTATILAAGAMIAAIPVALDTGPDRTPIAVGLVIGGGTTFVLGLLINAFLRPNHDDLVRLVDRHDALVGRR